MNKTIRKNQIKLFLLRLLAFFIIVFLFDYSIGSLLRHFYFKQESGLQYRTTYAIEKTNADILIFGSSRANHHYRPDVFENRMKLSFYNAGRDGNFMFYHLAVLKGVLNRYSPKIVILDFVAEEFAQNQYSYDRLSSLLPYYKSHPEMRPIINLKSKYEKIKLVSQIYPYNSLMLTIAVGNSGVNKKRKSDIQGYVPITKVWNGPIQVDNISSYYQIDSIKVKAYEAFIQDCVQANVALYIVCSPYYIKSDQVDYSIVLGQNIAESYGIKFIDYSKDTIFTNNSALFADIGHLNDNGAEVFSNILIDQINTH